MIPRFVIYKITRKSYTFPSKDYTKIISYERLRFRKKLLMEVDEDSCFIGIPYKLHLIFERLIFNIPGKRTKYLTVILAWKLSRLWKLTDFFYGLVSGFPICCSLFYALRKNPSNQEYLYGNEENYSKCPYCLSKDQEGKKYANNGSNKKKNCSEEKIRIQNMQRLWKKKLNKCYKV